MEIEDGGGFFAGDGGFAAADGGDGAADEAAEDFVEEGHAVAFVGSEGEEGGDLVGVGGGLAVFIDGGSGRQWFAFAFEGLDAAHGDGGGGPVHDDGEAVGCGGGDAP